MKKNKIRIFLLIALIIVIILNAWLCDDAYISFRVIKNFVNGYGLRWNIFERVQVFTNPLMVLLLIPFYTLTHEIYYTAIFFNIITVSIALYILLFKIAKNNYSATFITIAMLCSRSFIGFSTSGLENSLTFLLLSIFFYVLFKKEEYFKKDILTLSFIGSLILLNRMDSVLLIIPSFLYILKKRNKNINFFKFALYFLIGMIPFIMWELFAIIYYGFFFPNTYFAKLTTGISKWEYIKNGLKYFLTVSCLDPVTVLTIILGIGIIYNSLERKYCLPLFGAIISIIYIIYVGGDFMLGRFLTPAFFTIIITLAYLKKEDFKNEWNKRFILALIILPTSLFIFIKQPKNLYFWNGVADEQAFYFEKSSLLKVGSEKELKSITYDIVTYNDSKVSVAGCIGFYGYFADDDTKIIDVLALADPLLARIPSRNKRLTRIAHISRPMPNGYVDTVISGENVITDQNIAKFYDVIKTITQEPIFSKKRIKTIINYHLGKYNYLIDK